MDYQIIMYVVMVTEHKATPNLSQSNGSFLSHDIINLGFNFNTVVGTIIKQIKFIHYFKIPLMVVNINKIRLKNYLSKFIIRSFIEISNI